MKKLKFLYLGTEWWYCPEILCVLFKLHIATLYELSSKNWLVTNGLKGWCHKDIDPKSGMPATTKGVACCML